MSISDGSEWFTEGVNNIADALTLIRIMGSKNNYQEFCYLAKKLGLLKELHFFALSCSELAQDNDKSGSAKSCNNAIREYLLDKSDDNLENMRLERKISGSVADAYSSSAKIYNYARSAYAASSYSKNAAEYSAAKDAANAVEGAFYANSAAHDASRAVDPNNDKKVDCFAAYVAEDVSEVISADEIDGLLKNIFINEGDK